MCAEAKSLLKTSFIVVNFVPYLYICSSSNMTAEKSPLKIWGLNFDVFDFAETTADAQTATYNISI